MKYFKFEPGDIVKIKNSKHKMNEYIVDCLERKRDNKCQYYNNYGIIELNKYNDNYIDDKYKYIRLH